jgi:Domain of unknown function (DUF6438)
MFVLKCLSFASVCLLIACGRPISQPEIIMPPNNDNVKIELSLKMERTSCFGDCPIYVLSIQPDGTFKFEGIKSLVKGILVDKKEKAHSKLSDDKIKQIIAEIDKADFFALKDSYTGDSGNCPTYWTDSSTVIVEIQLRGKHKSIPHYLGCEENDNPSDKGKIYPQALYNLENRIDEIVETNRWIGKN